MGLFLFMDTIQLLILILATWRASSLLVYEDGPYLVLERLRGRLGVVYDERSQRSGTNELARALTCLWCVSVWVGALWAAAFVLWQGTIWLALPFALSGGAVLVERWAGRE